MIIIIIIITINIIVIKREKDIYPGRFSYSVGAVGFFSSGERGRGLKLTIYTPI